MRQTRSAESPVELSSSRSDASGVIGRQSSSELNVSIQLFHGSTNSEAAFRDNARLTGSSGGNYGGQTTRTASAYNYPELGYRPISSAQDSQAYASQHIPSQREIEMADDQASNTYENGQTAASSGMHNNVSPSDGFGVDSRYHMSPSQQNQHSQEYPNVIGSMSHIRWNPASKGSPLRKELGSAEAIAKIPGARGSLGTLQGIMTQPTISVSGGTTGGRTNLNTSTPSSSSAGLDHMQQQVSQVYATLPRTGYQMQQGLAERDYARGQIPTDMGVANGSGDSFSPTWSQTSPYIGGQGSNPNKQQQHNAANPNSERMRRNSVYSFSSPDPRAAQGSGSETNQDNVHGRQAPSVLKDYYAISSPGAQSHNDTQVSRADSTSLLPTVEVNQGLLQPLSSNMDEINAHSQEYLHRRRRRLTQTLHNRKRSGSSIDVSARLSVSRVNNAPNSSSANSAPIDGFVADGHAAQALGGAMDVSPTSVLEPDHYGNLSYNAPQTGSYGGTISSSYTNVDPRNSIYVQAQAQAQAQADYLQRLQQERIQQEQISMALEQQRLKLKLAQEQELIRFRNYKPLLNLTVDIVETYRKCHANFYYESARRPRRVLTHPSEGVKNDGFDNENSDYILYVNDIIGDKDGHQYLIIDMLGSGTFGQVVKCQNTKTGEMVAVKVIKNKMAYYNQSMMEVQMLDILNKEYDIEDKHHILRLKEWFVFRRHLVFVNEL
ncbi:dual specificity protein kinase yak1, partial [Coemansia sp. RSA 2049]